MEIPGNIRDRDALYVNLMRSGELASRTERRDRYRKMRALQLTGTETAQRARFNGLREWIRKSSSMIYSAKSLSIGLEYPPYYGGKDDTRLTSDDLAEMTELMREELHRVWADSEMPTVCGQAVSMAHWMDTVCVKLFVQRDEIHLGLVPDTSDMFVGDERLPWSQQEVIGQFYSVSMPYLNRMLLASGMDDKRRAEIMASARDEATPQRENRGDVLPGALPSLIIASVNPTVGSVVNRTETMLAQPQSKEPVVTICEMWVWDDHARKLCAKCLERRRSWRHSEEWIKDGAGHEYEEGDTCPDWRAVTLLDSSLDVLYDPLNPLGIDGHAFFPLCLEPDTQANYTWGVAPMEMLVGPQIEHEIMLQQDATRDELDVNPPISGYGVPIRDGETTKAWRKPGADIPLTNPQAKIEFHRPPPLPDKYERVDRQMNRFRLLQGIPKAMTGEMDASMRAGDQMVSGAMLGAGPTLEHALTVETWLETILTAVGRLHREMLRTPLVRDSGERFLLRHLPGDFVARVWGHSASPIYTEHLFQKAAALRKTGDISGEDFLLYANLPGNDMLRRKHKKLEEAQAQKSEKVINLKEREVKSKEVSAEAKLLKS